MPAYIRQRAAVVAFVPIGQGGLLAKAAGRIPGGDYLFEDGECGTIHSPWPAEPLRDRPQLRGLFLPDPAVLYAHSWAGGASDGITVGLRARLVAETTDSNRARNYIS